MRTNRSRKPVQLLLLWRLHRNSPACYSCRCFTAVVTYGMDNLITMSWHCFHLATLAMSLLRVCRLLAQAAPSPKLASAPYVRFPVNLRDVESSKTIQMPKSVPMRSLIKGAAPDFSTLVRTITSPGCCRFDSHMVPNARRHVRTEDGFLRDAQPPTTLIWQRQESSLIIPR